MARPVRFIPGVEGAPEIEVVPDVIRGARVFVAGRRIPPIREGRHRVHPIPMADGTTRPLRLVGGFVALRAVFEGLVYQIEPRLRLWETFLAVLPLAILALGLDAPTLGGTIAAALIAGIAVGAALVAIRSQRPSPVRAAAALAASVVGYVIAQVIMASL